MNDTKEMITRLANKFALEQQERKPLTKEEFEQRRQLLKRQTEELMKRKTA